ncbi:Bifunctional protein folC [Raoultella terrigena]|uniref:Bifunctional protein folC n=1 Tax=Raoultella terrigena TaxID=577 RepID=A0A3P8JFM1_RAOTE|nr:Bifunctional protein folC [Raoultella terrigena]
MSVFTVTLADIMEKEPIPQATSPLATWLSYLEHLHSKTIDLGLTRVNEVAGRMAVVKPAPFVFTVAEPTVRGPPAVRWNRC